MMTSVKAQPYPELRQLFGVYLNAEFMARYGSVPEALAAYRRETGAAHRIAARGELDHLIAIPGAMLKLNIYFTRLGCDVTLKSAGDALSLAALVRRALDDGDGLA
jgi:hypothetical protein